MSLSRSALPRHGRRALVASGLTAALVLVPAGMASAAPEDPAAPVTDLAEDLLGGSGDAAAPGAGDLPGGELPIGDLPGGDLPIGDLPTGGTGTGDGGTGGTDGAGAVDPAAELAALLEELGLPAECVSGFQAVVEGLADELAGLPEEAPDVLTDLVAGLQEAFATQDPAALQAALEDLLGADVLAELEAALTACLPVEEEPEPEPETPVVAPPAPEQPAPPAAQPVAQPVSYPGYAPTGADTARADDVSVPLTALGGGLVLVAAGAAGYGMRGRAVRTRD